MSQYLSTDNLTSLANQVLSVVQPLLGQAGGLLGSLASGTASTVGRGFFVILVSYFVLVDMRQVPDRLLNVEIPGYGDDFRRLTRELNHIWDAFLRGQVVLFTLTLLIFSFVLSALGVRYFIALALLAGLARFVPYFGSWVTWTVTVLVAYFQPGNYLGLAGWQYALLVIAMVVFIDQIFDNIVSPRFLGRTLGVHPAGVFVAAVIGANLLGLVGVVLAAPALASVVLIGRYILRKMLDLPPWPEPEITPESSGYPWAKWGNQLVEVTRQIKKRLAKRK